MNAAEAEGTRGSIARSLSASAGRGVNVILSVVSSVILARAMAPAERGQFAIAASITGIGVQCVTFGLPASVLYFSVLDRGVLPALHRRAQATMALASGAFAVAVGAAWLFYSPGWCSEVDGAVLGLACANVAVCGGMMISQSACLASGDAVRYGWSDAASRLLSIASFIIVIVFCGLGPTSALLATVASGIVTITWLVGAPGLATGTGRRNCPPLSTELRYGLKSAVAGALGSIPVRTMLLAVASREGESAGGQFAVALGVAETLVAMAGAFAATRLASMVATRNNPSEARRSVVSVLLPVSAGAAASALVIATCARPIFLLAFGDRYAEAAGILVECTPGATALAMASVLQYALAARGLPLGALVAPAVAATSAWMLLAFAYPAGLLPIGAVFSVQAIVFLACSGLALMFRLRAEARAQLANETRHDA